MKPLISARQLARDLRQVKLFDIRWSLTDPGYGMGAYEEGHIPGAVFVDLDRDLAAPPGAGRHPLPESSEFTTTLGRLGVSPDDRVVVYDDTGGSVAARMWWMMWAIGHRAAQVLDGGLQAWVEAGGDMERGRVAPTPALYPAVPAFAGVLAHDQLEGHQIIDVRAPERYRGEIEPVDPKAGHIPGAINIPLQENLAADKRFRSPADLAALYRSVSEDPVISCGSGVNACHTALALVLAGHGMPNVYVGSFSDWSRRDLPVDTGPGP